MNTRRAAVIVIVVTLIAHAPAVPNAFTTWDDNYNITQNPHVNPHADPPAVDGLKYLWTHAWMHLWVPVTYTIWIALAEISNLNPHWFHATNVIVHVCAAVGTLVLLRRLKFSTNAAMFGALLFAVHPVQIESVAWVSGLKDVLSGALCIASLLCLRGERRRTIAACALYVLAMLAKPQAVALPLVVFAIDRWIFERSMRESLKTVAPMLLLAIPIIVIGKLVQPASDVGHVPLWWRPLIAGEGLAFYVWKLLFPVKLGVDYGHSPTWVMRSGVGYFAWLTPVALLIFARPRVYRAAVAVFLAALLPILGFVTFDFQGKSTVADHYLYFAMLGVAIGVAAFVERTHPKWQRVFVIIVAALALRSMIQTRTWADSRTLFTNAIAVNPDSFVAYNNLYVLAMDARDGAEAEQHARKMLALKPNDMLSTTNLAGALAMQSRYAEAEHLYREATTRWPNEVDPHVGLGVTLLDQNRPREAIDAFDAALRIEPKNRLVIDLRARAQRQAAQP